MSSTAAQTVPAYRLSFSQWECGHHQQMPAPIEVSSPGQAMLILRAIAAAISQPGSARAHICSDTSYLEVYVTDDYIDPHEPGNEGGWADRPLVVYGNATAQAELIKPIHIAALQDLQWQVSDLAHEAWDGMRPLDGGEFVHTAMSLADLRALLSTSDESPAARGAPPRHIDADELLSQVIAWEKDNSEETDLQPADLGVAP